MKHIIASHRPFLYQIREFRICENLLCITLRFDTVWAVFMTTIPTGMFLRHKEALTSVLLMEIELKCFGFLCSVGSDQTQKSTI
jgi:hypothetical protein